MKLILEVTDDARGTRNIEFEGHSRNNMMRQGLKPDMFTLGDIITIQVKSANPISRQIDYNLYD